MPHGARLVRTAVLAVVLALTSAALAAPATAASDGTITGKVTGGGNPLQGVTVQAVTVIGITPPSLEVEASTTTAADGTYRLTGVPSYAVRLQFVPAGAVGGTSATGYGDLCLGGDGTCLSSGRELTVPPGATRTVNVALSRAGVVQGRLIDSRGRGIGGLDVWLYTGGNDQSGDSFDSPYRTATSDADGNYSFSRLYAHTYSICLGHDDARLLGTPNPDGYVGTCATSGVTVASGRVTTRTNQLVGGGGIAGTVVDTSGRPIAGAGVDAYVGASTFPFASATAKTNGRFRLGSLPPSSVPFPSINDICVSAPRYVQRCGIPATITEFGTTQLGRIVLTRES